MSGRRSGGFSNGLIRSAISDRAVAFIATTALVALTGPAARAVDLYWDQNGASANTGGTGNWTTANAGNPWRNGSATGTLQAWADGNNAIFGGTAGTVTNTVNVSATGLTLSTTGYTLTGSGATLTLTGTPTIFLGSGIVATAGTFTSNSNGTAYLKGTAGMTVDGGGELILAAGLQSSLSGGVKVTGGSILTLGDRTQGTGAIVNISSGSGTTGFFGGNSLTLDNGTVRLAASSTANSAASGIGTISVSNAGTFTIHRTASSASMSPVLTSNVTMNAGSSLSVTTAGNTTGSPTLQFGSLTANGNFTLQAQNAAVTAALRFGTISDGGFQMTLLGGGTSTAVGFNPINSYTAAGSSFTGSLVLGNAGGTQGALFAPASSASTAMTSGSITVNRYSQLLVGFTGNFGAANSVLTLNGIGNQTNAGSVNSGAIRADQSSGTATWLGSTVLGSNAIVRVTNGTLVLNGSVSGSFELNKAGAGTLTLAGANNSYDGSTFLANGTITVNSGSGLGSGSLKMGDDTGNSSVTLNLDNAAQSIGSLTQGAAVLTRTINLGTNHALTIVQTTPATYDGTIDGSSASVTLGAGSNSALTLTGTNGYGGGTFINAGTLKVGASANILADSGVVTLGGGTLDINAFNETVGAVTLDSGSIINSGGDQTKALTGSAYSLKSGTVSAVLAGSSVVLTKATDGTGGGGTVVLSGVNTYTGGTNINAGTLQFGAAVNILPDAGAVTLGGGTLDINAFNETVGAVTLNSGSIVNTGADQTKAMTGSSYNVKSGTVSAVLAGSSIALTKNTDGTGGGGTVLLSGANTYTGNTTLAAGTLQVGVDSVGSVGSITSSAVGRGTLILNGGTLSSSAATTTGDRTILNPVTLGGDVTLGNATNNGVLTFSAAGSLTGSRQLTIDSPVTYGGVISDGASDFTLTKTGNAFLVLSGANTYSGGTVVSTGSLQVGVDSVGSVGSITSSAVGTGPLALNGGTLSSSAVAAERTILNPVTFGGDVTLGHSIYNGALTFSAAGTLTGNRQLTVNSPITYGGSIGGAFGLTKAGSSTLTLSAANTYEGTTVVSDGTLVVAASGALGTAAGGTNVADGATLGIQGGITYLPAEPITLNGGGALGAGALQNVSDTNSLNVLISLGSDSTIRASADNLLLGNTVSIGNYRLTVDGAGNVLANSAVTGGTGGITKSGAGTLTLGANNTYGGNTIVSAGVMKLEGGGTNNVANSPLISVAAGTTLNVVDVGGPNANAFAVADGQTLGGNGTVTGTVTVGDGILGGPERTIAPGVSGTNNGIGQLTTGRQIWATDGTYEWEFGAGTGSFGDLLTINGELFVSAGEVGFTISIVRAAGTTAPTSNTWYEVATATSANMTPAELEDFLLPEPAESGEEWELQVLSTGATSISIQVRPVPEPASAALLAAGGAGLLARRRRRLR